MEGFYLLRKLDFSSLNKFIDYKIGLNTKWTNKYVKLKNIIKKYQREPNKELLEKINKECFSLDILIE